MLHILTKGISLVTGAVLMLAMTVPVQAATNNDSGISTGGTLLNLTDTQLDSRLHDMQILGVKWIRMDFSWSVIQPDRYDQYNWASYDRVVGAIEKRGFKVLATLTYAPPWARNARCARLKPAEESGSKCAPRSATEFARFARASVLRYESHSLHAWEIWNEPNLVGHWKTAIQGGHIIVDPADYAVIANAAARELKRYDPRAFVITGGLAPVAEKKYPLGMRQGDYLKRLLPKLNKKLFNAVGIHPYTWPNLPDIAVGYNAFYTVDHGRPDVNLRTIMGRAGWSTKQIWATEFGASTTGLVSPQQAKITKKRADHVTESTQAQIIRVGLLRWEKKVNVGPIFIHAVSDQLLLPRKNEGGFGLRRMDNSKKPSYNAFKVASGQ